MNESGKSAGPTRSSKKIELDHVIVSDEIDLPFGEIRSRLGGSLAGHNGLKSLKAFASGTWRIRVGVNQARLDRPRAGLEPFSGAHTEAGR